jgi:hypothetical protein
MALQLNLDHNNRAYYTLTCDRCAAPFVCYDDASYSFTSLRTAATFAGWDIGARPELPHHCPTCVRRLCATSPAQAHRTT